MADRFLPRLSLDDELLPLTVEDGGDVGLNDDLGRHELVVLRGLCGLELTSKSLAKCSQKIELVESEIIN